MAALHNPHLEHRPGTAGSDPSSLLFEQKAVVKKHRGLSCAFPGPMVQPADFLPHDHRVGLRIRKSSKGKTTVWAPRKGEALVFPLTILHRSKEIY